LLYHTTKNFTVPHPNVIKTVVITATLPVKVNHCGHSDVNLLEDEDCEEGEQHVYSATGTRLGIMKTAEQFEKPMNERFALGDFGKTDLGADAFNLDVMALQGEPGSVGRKFAELSPKCFARSANHVMPPLLAEYSSDEDDYLSCTG